MANTKLTQAQREQSYRQQNQYREQEQLVKEWLRQRAINPKTFERAHKDTLQAIKVAKGILENPKYPLTQAQSKQFQSFIIKANKGKNTGKETVDVFRQARAIKRKTVSSLR